METDAVKDETVAVSVFRIAATVWADVVAWRPGGGSVGLDFGEKTGMRIHNKAANDEA